MRFRIRSCPVAALALIGTVLCTAANATEKLKGFYSGSGGISQEVHRVLLVEFAADGTAILEQTWQGKDPETWHAHWTQQSKQVTVTFDPIRDKPTPEPLALNIKHGTLVPTSWDASILGVLGPPKLAPFGGKNVQTQSVATCQSLHNPNKTCVTWDSRH